MNQSGWGAKRDAPGGFTSWNRLKPVRQDELMAYGLPSKGETRLNNSKAQEAYFQVIFERYMRFCNSSRDTLSAEFAKLSVASQPATSIKSSKWATNVQNSSTSPSSSVEQSIEPSPELSLIHMSMRKLRESIHATRRTDDFARDAYLFIARASILGKSWQAYVPALTHLTRFICPPNQSSSKSLKTSTQKSQLSESDERAVASWIMLDKACRLSDYEAAIEIAFGSSSTFSKPDNTCVKLVMAFIHGDFASWNVLMKKVDGYAAAIASFASPKIRKHALKCLAVTYLEVDKQWVEQCADMKWDELVKVEGVGWELIEREKSNNEKVEIIVIRRVKGQGEKK